MNRKEYHQSISEEEVDQLLNALRTYQPIVFGNY